MRKILPAILVVMILILAACQPSGTIQPMPTQQVTASPQVAVVTPTITPIPSRSLSVCLGQEPSSLYIYAASSRAMWSVLEAVYDGPIDTVHYIPQPVILQSLPAAADGSASLQPVEVQAGQEVVDAYGYLAVLEAALRLAKGNYFTYGAKTRFRHLIYPVPDPTLPFLGVHFTRMIDGSLEAGPNAVLAFKREGYAKTSFSARDTWETLTYPGFWRMARGFWKTGMDEYRRSFHKPAFVRALQRLMPDDGLICHPALRSKMTSPWSFSSRYSLSPGKNSIPRMYISKASSMRSIKLW